MKPDFTQSVSVFPVTVIAVFCYFNGFPHDAAKAGLDLDYDPCPVLSQMMLCSVSLEYSATAICWFSSLVSLMCSKVLIDMWQPIWPMYALPHEQGSCALWTVTWGLSVPGGPEVRCAGGTVATLSRTKAISKNKNCKRGHLPHIYSIVDMPKVLKKRDIHAIQKPLNKVVHQ